MPASALLSAAAASGNGLKSAGRSGLARRLPSLRGVRPRSGPIRTPTETPRVTPQRPLLVREADPLSQALLVRVFVALPQVRAELGDCPPRPAASQRQVKGAACYQRSLGRRAELGSCDRCGAAHPVPDRQLHVTRTHETEFPPMSRRNRDRGGLPEAYIALAEIIIRAVWSLAYGIALVIVGILQTVLSTHRSRRP